MIRTLFHPIMEQVDQALREKEEKQRRSGYWTPCPGCGLLVVKKELKKKGCYACGWREAEMALDPPPARPAPGTSGLVKQRPRAWRMECPNCGRKVVREHWERQGCYVCGKGPGREAD